MSRRVSLWRMNRQYSINYIKNINFTPRNDFVQSYMKYISVTNLPIRKFVAWVRKNNNVYIFLRSLTQLRGFQLTLANLECENVEKDKE